MVEHFILASQTSRFYGNLKNIIKMTTLHARTTIQIKGKTYRTEKHTNKTYILNEVYRTMNPFSFYTFCINGTVFCHDDIFVTENWSGIQVFEIL